MQSSIALLCLVVLVCVHSSVTDTLDTLDTQDTHLSRHRRVRSVGDIVDGLTTKFSKYLSSVFDVDEDDFKDILKALGKLKLAVLKALLNKFFDLKDKHHDFGSAENFQRVSQMMESLEADIQQQEATSGVTQDTQLSRPVDGIVNGLTTKFSKYLSSVFDVDEDDFKDILKALGKLKLAVLKALLNKFFDLKDKHHDFGSAENFQRVSQMMESLEADIQQQEATSGVTQDTQLSRPVDGIVDGLTTKFSKYLSSVFDVDEDDFKDILKALGKLKLAVLKALLNKFFDLKDKHHDFGSAENFQRVSQMMESLEADIQQQEASSGAPAAYVTMTSLTIPLLPVIAKVLN